MAATPGKSPATGGQWPRSAMAATEGTYAAKHQVRCHRPAEGRPPQGRGSVRKVRKGPRRGAEKAAGARDLHRTHDPRDDRGGDLLSVLPGKDRGRGRAG